MRVAAKHLVTGMRVHAMPLETVALDGVTPVVFAPEDLRVHRVEPRDGPWRATHTFVQMMNEARGGRITRNVQAPNGALFEVTP